jgi:hypothetical protein
MHGTRDGRVNLLTVGRRTDPQNVALDGSLTNTVSVMSMAQLVIGAALGFMIAQGVLYGVKHLLGWLQREGTTPPRAHIYLSSLIRYAGPVAASAALITLGVWAVGDYFAAKSARAADTANVFDPSTADATPADSHVDEVAGAPLAPKIAPPTEAPVAGVDPYGDPDFKVHRRAHHAGTPLSLKEALLQKSEAKARAELVQDTRLHVRRSQYDCEALDHVERYLKADLDVWGFAAWQAKYFPADAFTGATLTQCQDIQDIVDHSGLDLHSTVAGNHP